jgi:hypothetical protein
MRATLRRRGVVALLALGALAWTACSDLEEALVAPDGPDLSSASQAPGIEEAIAAQERHSEALMAVPGVVGTAVGLLDDGRPTVRVLVSGPDRPRIPDALDGVPVSVKFTGMLRALSDPTQKQRPAPLGFSVGHPDITAGTIGVRVVDDLGNVYVLSNNHVLAASNAGSIGDPILQPGTFDGGTLADQFATLADYYVIDFSFSGHNTMDAAIALSTEAELDNASPLDDAYGAPSSVIWGDADADGFFDNPNQLLGLAVKKYGRTTGLTHGQVTDVNAFVEVCYIALFNLCLTSGYFYDQVIIEPGSFSDGGDSGSLIVTDDDESNPALLLFAGSETVTIANRIDLVLDYFDVTIDGKDAVPPTPVTDLATTAVSAPASVTEGETVEVGVTVENVGNQDVDQFTVSLWDDTDNVEIGSQLFPGLNAGANAAVAFQWTTTGSSIGDHSLRAFHSLVDDDAANDEATATVAVMEPGALTAVHVGDLDGSTASNGGTWSADVWVAVHGDDHAALPGATVTGVWNPGGQVASCVTEGPVGSAGCTVSVAGIRKRDKQVSFTVTSVSMPAVPYDAAANHDPDGDSDGTSITVVR